jgi:flagellin-like protein
MGFRFRRRLRLGQGVWLNFSKRGSGPIVGLLLIVAMVLLLAALAGH